MKTILLNLLIRILIRFVNLEGNHPIPASARAIDRDIQNFLASAYSHPHFKKYLLWRDGRIIFELSGGMGMAERERSDYIRFVGQRAELLLFGKYGKEAFEIRQKEKDLRNKAQRDKAHADAAKAAKP